MGHGPTVGPPPWAARPSRAQARHSGYWVSLRPFPGHRRSRWGSSDFVTGAPSQGRWSAKFLHVAGRTSILRPTEHGWGWACGPRRRLRWPPPLLCSVNQCFEDISAPQSGFLGTLGQPQVRGGGHSWGWQGTSVRAALGCLPTGVSHNVHTCNVVFELNCLRT